MSERSSPGRQSSWWAEKAGFQEEIMGRPFRMQRFPAAPARTPVAAPAEVTRFATHDDLLEGALGMLEARAHARRQAEQQERSPERDPAQVAAAWELSESWAAWFHASFERSKDRLVLCRRVLEAGLLPLERELLLALLLSQLGATRARINNIGDLVDEVRTPGMRALEALRDLGEDSRLVRSGLVCFEDPDEEPSERTPLPAPELLARLLGPDATAGEEPRGLEVDSQEALFGALTGFTRAAQAKAEALSDRARAMMMRRSPGLLPRRIYRLECLFQAVQATLGAHPDWPLATLFAQPGLGNGERMALLVLLGRDGGHLPADHPLYLGLGLARVLAPSEARVADCLGALSPRGTLLGTGLVQACDGPAELLSDHPSALAEVAFELGDRARELLGLDEARKARAGAEGVREARVRLSQLVLPPAVRLALRMALAQARHGRVMLGDWGLGKSIAYGRGVTLLFSGPPGVGKTAAAEGLARELGLPILVADYAQIQNMFVGGTEKNIAATFRRARRAHALLFWDEADAMFYGRDQGQRPWEVRDVNVLLTELERFEGVCVLATNRPGSLDAALERRVTLKVEFSAPDRVAREKIWRKLLPRKLPLAEDVDLARLAEAALSGGEIKNAVLNAARLAILRGPRARVRMADLEKAVALELGGRLQKTNVHALGFQAGGA